MPPRGRKPKGRGRGAADDVDPARTPEETEQVAGPSGTGSQSIMSPQAKRKSSKNGGRGAALKQRPPEERHTVPMPPPLSEEADSEASSASQCPDHKKKRKKTDAADGDRQYPWKDGHQDALAEFWLSHPIFYDKAQQHYKNKDMKIRLMQELIQESREDWEKIYRPLPTVSQVDAHLRNMRTRFVKLLKRKSGAPATTMSYTDQKILDRYQFLRPHIQRNRTTATHTFAGVQRGRDAEDDEGDDDDDNDDSQGSEQPSTSQIQRKGTGKGIGRKPPSSVRDSEDMSEIEMIQQAQSLISSIRVPTKSEHERRVRDFSRYMESEMLRIPESSWDECSFSIMNIIRGFKTGRQQDHLTIPQQQAYQQSYEGQYRQQQGGYYTQQTGTLLQTQQPATFQQQGNFQQQDNLQHQGNILQSGNVQEQSGTFTQLLVQQPSAFQQQRCKAGTLCTQEEDSD